MKAWCIWCESDNNQKLGTGYYWIHIKCAHELMDYASDIKSIKEMLEGTHIRNKKDNDKLNVVYNFIKDMEGFKRKWEGTMKQLTAFQSTTQGGKK